MSILEVLTSIAKPLTLKTSTPLRKMTDAQLFDAIAECGRGLEAGTADLQRLEPLLAEAAAEAFAGAQPAALTRNSEAMAKANTALSGLRTTLAGLHAERTRRTVVAEADARAVRLAAQVASHDKVSNLIERFDSWVAQGGPLVVELRIALGEHFALLTDPQRDGLNATGKPNAVVGELNIALARATEGLMGNFQGFSKYDASRRPSLAEQFARNRHVLTLPLESAKDERTAA